MKKIPIYLIFLYYFIFTLLATGTSYSSDIGNCLLCHKYPGLSRITKEGKLRLLYVNESIFSNSVHSKVKCEDCHTDIKAIPHDPAKKVDCLTECHIIEPSSEEKFSHKNVASFLSNSVHGKYDINEKTKEHPEDFPYCKNCHDNPLYRPLSFDKVVRPGVSETSLGRCRVCHKKDSFIYRFYNHVTTRLHKIRNPKNIAEVCAKCHDNEELVRRHNLKSKAAFSYGETFHGKAASFLSERVPDCLDCHVRKGESVHQMLSYKDSRAPTNQKNKANICTNVECHPKADPKLARYKVHPEFDLNKSPAIYYFTVFFILITGGSLLPLMGLIFLDLVRRLFPKATLIRRDK